MNKGRYSSTQGNQTSIVAGLFGFLRAKMVSFTVWSLKSLELSRK